MNCERGDLAIVISGDKEDRNLIGKIIKVGEFDPDWHQPAWNYVGDRLKDVNGNTILSFNDAGLRPLRDNPGTDETLLWAPVPSKLKEKA